MKKTKLISVIASLNEKELKAFEKYVSSAYHSGSRNLLPLLKQIKKYYPGFTDPKFTKENLYKKLHPGEQYDDSYMRKQMSFLYKMAEDFLVTLEIEEMDNERSILLMNQLRKRELYNLFEIQSQKVKKEITPDKYGLQDYFAERFRYEMIMYNNYYDSQSDPKKAIPHISTQLREVTSLFFFVLINTIKSAKVIKENFTIDFDNNLTELLQDVVDIEKFIKLNKFDSKAKLILIDYYLGKASEDLERETYFKAKDFLIKNIAGLSTSMKYRYFEELCNINLTLLRFGQNEINRKEIFKENFETIKLQEKYGALISGDNKMMSVNAFSAILNTALALGDYKWMQKFIDEYSGKVPPAHRDDMRNLGYAVMNFANGRYEKSLEYLIYVKIKNPVLKLTVRDMNLSIFYELRLFEEARYLITTSQKYYSSTKELAPNAKQAGMNFLKYYRELVKLAEQKDKVEAGRQLVLLQKESNADGKRWLLKKFEELAK